MRYDYGLYLMAIACFGLACFLFMGYAGYIELTIGNETIDLFIAMSSAFFWTLGVAFVIIGYGARREKPVTTQLPLPKLSAEKELRVATSDSGRCPKCGGEVAALRKTWKTVGRPNKVGEKVELTIGLFDCPNCYESFTVVLEERKI